jgi:8-oxo-dGTP diphosphatase
MKKYALGFVFTPSFEDVLLIHKNRPARQAGKINGVGGKIEEGEDSLGCIVRETLEETGLYTDPHDWINFALMLGKDWSVEVYALVHNGSLEDAKTAEDQKIEWFNPKNLPTNVVGNLHWLIPAAIEKLQNNSFGKMAIEY